MDAVNLLLQIAGGLSGSFAIRSGVTTPRLTKSAALVAAVIGGGLGIQVVNLALGLPMSVAAARTVDAPTLVAQLTGAAVGSACLALLMAMLAPLGAGKLPLKT